MIPYPSSRSSGIDWLGDIPEHWEINKLKHLTKVKLSNVDKKSKENEPVVQLCNYVDIYYNERITGDIVFMVATARPDQVQELSLESGDVIITKDSETPDDIAVPAYVPATLPGVVCGYHLALIRPSQGKVIGNYIFRSFMANGLKDQFEFSANGITRFGISKFTIENALFLVPPLPEQITIVNYLDRKTAQIDATIKLKERQIELLREKRIVLISQAVTKGLNPDADMRDSGIGWLGEIPAHWKLKRIKHLAEVNRAALSEETDPNYEFFYIDIGNVSLGEISNKIRKIRFENAPSRARRILQAGDVLVSTVRTYLKAIAHFSMNGDEFIASTGFAVISPKLINDRYFAYFMMCEKVIDRISALSVGVSYPAVNSSDVANIPVWYPPVLDEQIEIAMYIDKKTIEIDNIIATTQKIINLLYEFRASLISAAVTGKVDVREEVGE